MFSFIEYVTWAQYPYNYGNGFIMKTINTAAANATTGLRVVRKKREVVLANGKSVFLISHSGVNGWTPEIAREITQAIKNGEYVSIVERSKGVMFPTFCNDITIIGLYDLDDDVAWSHKTRAFRTDWADCLLG